jgi:hypothetical protein
LISPDNTELIQKLDAFLAKTSWILQKCDSEFSTQINESFNRGKLEYASKDLKWGFTWIARMSCAVLDRNHPFWKLELRRRLCCTMGLPPLSDLVEMMLAAEEEQRLGRKKACHSEKYRELARAEKKAICDGLRAQAALARARGEKIGYKKKPGK